MRAVSGIRAERQGHLEIWNGKICVVSGGAEQRYAKRRKTYSVILDKRFKHERAVADERDVVLDTGRCQLVDANLDV
jgi:hypothetical protein